MAGVYIVKCISSGTVVVPTSQGGKALAPGEEFDIAAGSSANWLCYNDELADLIENGYIAVITNTFTDQPRAGSFAYATASSVRITTAANVWYPFPDSWGNVIQNNFLISPTYDYIIYDGRCPLAFEFQTNCTWESDTNNTMLSIALRHNTVVDTASIQSGKIVNLVDFINISNTAVLTLSPGDTIQLIVRSNKAGAILTLHSMTTSAQKFY